MVFVSLYSFTRRHHFGSFVLMHDDGLNIWFEKKQRKSKVRFFVEKRNFIFSHHPIYFWKLFVIFLFTIFSLKTLFLSSYFFGISFPQFLRPVLTNNPAWWRNSIKSFVYERVEIINIISARWMKITSCTLMVITKRPIVNQVVMFYLMHFASLTLSYFITR